MADEPQVSRPDKSGAARTRRVLRPAPEPATLRERSEQAQAKSASPSRAGKAGRLLAKPFVAVGRLTAKAFRPLGRFKLVRVLGLILWPPYFRNAFKELRQVTWPDRRKTWRLTYAVIIFSVIFGLIVAGIDWVFDRIFRDFILR